MQVYWLVLEKRVCLLWDVFDFNYNLLQERCSATVTQTKEEQNTKRQVKCI